MKFVSVISNEVFNCKEERFAENGRYKKTFCGKETQENLPNGRVLE